MFDLPPSNPTAGEATMVFTPKLPKRSLGVLLVLLSTIGMFLMIGGTHDIKVNGPEMLITGIAITLLLFPPGLHLLIRRHQATITAQEIIIKRRSLLGTRVDHVPMREFGGLRQEAKRVAHFNDGLLTWIAPLPWIIGLLHLLMLPVSRRVLDNGAPWMKNASLHSLRLVHANDPSLCILLVRSYDSSHIDQAATELMQRFGLGLIANETD